MAAEIDRFLSAEMKDSAIPGAAVAVTRGDRVLMVRGYGHDSTGEAVTGDSLFRIASLSKSFTALAVMQLVDAGLLHLDDPVQDHLPEFQLADPRADQITVRQLLDHTSGLTDAVVPELSRTQPRTPTEATTSLRSARLASTPGTSWSYHNPNYQVAARLVEVLSGEPFDRYLRRHILEPAGMASSTSTATDDEPVPGLTEGHVTAYGHAIPAPGLGSFTVGDGGIVSSAADMARWLIVHANGGQAADGTRLVSGQGMRLLHTPSAPARRLRPGVGDPRSDRAPRPGWSTAAACSPSPPRRRSGRLGVRGGAAVQRRLADDARPDRDRARRLRHHRRHRPALERPAPGRDAGHRPGRAHVGGADPGRASASSVPVAGLDAAAAPRCARCSACFRR